MCEQCYSSVVLICFGAFLIFGLSAIGFLSFLDRRSKMLKYRNRKAYLESCLQWSEYGDCEGCLKVYDLVDVCIEYIDVCIRLGYKHSDIDRMIHECFGKCTISNYEGVSGSL